MVEIEPVFVGLLAAAFAFLFAELSRLVRETVMKMQDIEVVKFMWEEYGKGYGGGKGVKTFQRDYLRMVGKLYLPLLTSLPVYVMSVLFLASGYGVGHDGIVVTGIVLLIGSFLIVGFWLCKMYLMAVGGKGGLPE